MEGVAMITDSEPSGERVSYASTDDLGHVSRASFLLADTRHPGAPIAHLVYLWIPERSVCLALQAEALVVVRHVNQWRDTGDSISILPSMRQNPPTRARRYSDDQTCDDRSLTRCARDRSLRV